jgi:hypothetical protein
MSLLGMATRWHRWPDAWALALIALLTVAAGVATATGREAGVTTGDLVAGILVGALGFATLPALAYYALGRFVPLRPVVLAVWVVSLFPLFFYVVIVAFVTTGLVACPPDAYECPT